VFLSEFFSQKNLNIPKFAGENLYLKDVNDAYNLELSLMIVLVLKKKKRTSAFLLNKPYL
jgi:hypothetical protein